MDLLEAQNLSSSPVIDSNQWEAKEKNILNDTKKFVSDAMQATHLKKGIPMIRTCVGSEGYLMDNYEKDLVEKNAENVSFFNPYPGQLNDGKQTYTISEIDGKNKKSADFRECTGLIVTGIDKKTGKNISLLSHQCPRLPEDSLKKFKIDMKSRIDELRKRSVEGSIDSVIGGGTYHERDELTYSRDDYVNAINLLSDLVKNELGFNPTVIIGPKTISGKDTMILDTENNRMYLKREKSAMSSSENEIGLGGNPYDPSDIKTAEKNWLK